MIVMTMMVTTMMKMTSAAMKVMMKAAMKTMQKEKMMSTKQLKHLLINKDDADVSKHYTHSTMTPARSHVPQYWTQSQHLATQGLLHIILCKSETRSEWRSRHTYLAPPVSFPRPRACPHHLGALQV